MAELPLQLDGQHARGMKTGHAPVARKSSVRSSPAAAQEMTSAKEGGHRDEGSIL